VTVYDSVIDAVEETSANASAIYVGPAQAKQAAFEAIDAGIRLLMIASEFVPVHDCMAIRAYAERNGTWIVGPNTVGLVHPRRHILIGTLLPDGIRDGNVAVISRSGTLAVEVTRLLCAADLGVSFAVAIGGDMIVGRNPVDYLRELDRDPNTKLLVFIGEIGGLKEYEAAELVPRLETRLISYIAGAAAPSGKRLGHAGALVIGNRDTAKAKQAALASAGSIVADVISQIPELAKELLQPRTLNKWHRDALWTSL
jgi:succinyl-CoA synthetase alpha subunit